VAQLYPSFALAFRGATEYKGVIETDQAGVTKMTEDQIERRVEQTMNSLDRRLVANALTQAEYDREVKVLDRWPSQQFRSR
jgi:hypothetical protein